MKKTPQNPYIGVSWHTDKEMWQARVRGPRVEGHRRSFSCDFDDPETAALVRDRAALLIQGPAAELNFPGEPLPLDILASQVFRWVEACGFKGNELHPTPGG